jgi:DNA-binding transcriptional MerR regulator
MGQKSFSRKEVAEKLGIRDRTVWFYTEQGLVIPEIANPTGKGTTRLYSAKNIMEIAVCRKLAEQGLKLELVREIMRAGRLRRSKDSFDPWDPAQDTPVGDGHFFIGIYNPASEHPTMISWSDSSGEAVATRSFDMKRVEFEVCIILDLTAIREKIRAVLAQIFLESIS